MSNIFRNAIRLSLAVIATLSVATTVQAQTFTFGGPYTSAAGNGTMSISIGVNGLVRTFEAELTGTLFGAVNPKIGPLTETQVAGVTTYNQNGHPVFGDVVVTVTSGTVSIVTTNVPPPGVPLTGTGNFATTDLNNPTNSLALSLAETGGGGGTGTLNATLAAIVPTLTPVMTITLLGLMLLAGVTVLRRRTAMQATR